jgi:hypothetical protein
LVIFVPFVVQVIVFGAFRVFRGHLVAAMPRYVLCGAQE